MDFERVVKGRRSIRRFTTKKVSSRMIKKTVENATYAPTPCNQQLLKVVAITNDNIKNRLVSEAFSSTIIRRAPVVLVICYDAWNKKEGIQGGSFAAQNILLSATDSGLGSLSMNSFGNEKIIKKILKIPENYLVDCFILLGYPENVYKKIPPVKRRPVDEVLSFNGFNLIHPVHRSYNPEKWNKDDLIDYQKYYCRKTFLGKEMDILDDKEREIVKYALSDINDNKKILDVFSYDGCMLGLFPDTKITSVNLDSATESYVKEAVNLYCPNKRSSINYRLFDKLKGKFDVATMVYKAERLPRELRLESFSKIKKTLQKNGEFMIFSRRSSLLFSLFYYSLVKVFGDDFRKTGIYAFWGPYKPIKLRKLKRELRKSGFEIVSSKKYFLIPPFFNQVLQMFLQYLKSGGSSYLHREKHKNILTNILSGLINLQGMETSLFGSIVIIKAKKR